MKPESMAALREEQEANEGHVHLYGDAGHTSAHAQLQPRKVSTV